MEVYVDYLRGVQFEIKARQHSLLSDQPVGNGGQDGGVTPPELLLAALGSCAAYYAVLYLRKRGLPVEGTRVSVSATKAAQPARLNDFLIRVESGVPLTQDQQHGMRQAVEHCLIHNTLLHAPTIRIDIHP
jgi:uncharacterized OsmC-like protein